MSDNVGDLGIEKMIRLALAIQDFIEDMDITCAETIYQTDKVSENALGLIESLCEIVGYKTL